MPQQKYLISAPGKVILFGEHAVVYGKTAVACSVDLRSYLFIEKRLDNTLELSLPNLGINTPLTWKTSQLPYTTVNGQEKFCFNQQLYENLKAIASSIIEATTRNVVIGSVQDQQQKNAAIAFLYLYTILAAQQGNQEQYGLTVDIKSILPVGAGLGSSASYSVCLSTGILLSFDRISLPEKQHGDSQSQIISDWAFQVEKVFHGAPSGIDNTVATFGGALLFEKGGGIEYLKEFLSIRFLLTNTRVPRDTRTQVANVRLKHDKYPQIVDPIFDAIHNMSMRLKVLLEKENDLNKADLFQTLEDLIDLNHYLLNSLGVGHPALEKVREITMQHGLHSKLTGAGGGGCAFTLIRPDVSKETVEFVKKDLSHLGYDCFETVIGGKGVGVIEKNDVIDSQAFAMLEKRKLQDISGWQYFS